MQPRPPGRSGIGDYVSNAWQPAAHDLCPYFGNIALAKLIREISEPALTRIGDSIKAEDIDAFLRSFNKLTDACNSCHRGRWFLIYRYPRAYFFAVQQSTVPLHAE